MHEHNRGAEPKHMLSYLFHLVSESQGFVYWKFLFKKQLLLITSKKMSGKHLLLFWEMIFGENEHSTD